LLIIHHICKKLENIPQIFEYAEIRKNKFPIYDVGNSDDRTKIIKGQIYSSFLYNFVHRFRETAPLICRKLVGKDSNLLRLAAERLALEPDRNLFRDVQTWRNSRRKIRMEVWWGRRGDLRK
jgi:hypothetical protein